MPKFKKKPIVVEAEQFFPDKLPWPDGVEDRRQGSLIGSTQPYEIKTLEGTHAVIPGDWIITGIKGEKYPCKADIFEAKYDPVND